MNITLDEFEHFNVEVEMLLPDHDDLIQFNYPVRKEIF